MSLEKLEREVALRLRPLPRAPAQAPRLARPGVPSRLGGGKAAKGGGGGRRRAPRLMDAPTARASRAMDGHVRRLAGARASQFVDLLHDEFTKLPAAEDGSVLGQHLLRGLRGSRAVARALAAQGKAAAGGRRGGLPEGDPFLAYPALLALLGGGKGARVTWARVLRQVGGAAPADWGKGPGEPGEDARPGGVRQAHWRELEPEAGRGVPAGGDLYPAGGPGEGMGPVEEDDEDDLWAAGLPGPPAAAGVAAALPPGEGGGAFSGRQGHDESPPSSLEEAPAPPAPSSPGPASPRGGGEASPPPPRAPGAFPGDERADPAAPPARRISEGGSDAKEGAALRALQQSGTLTPQFLATEAFFEIVPSPEPEAPLAEEASAAPAAGGASGGGGSRSGGRSGGGGGGGGGDGSSGGRRGARLPGPWRGGRVAH